MRNNSEGKRVGAFGVKLARAAFLVAAAFSAMSCTGLWSGLHNPFDAENCEIDVFFNTWSQSARMNVFNSQLIAASGIQLLVCEINDGTFTYGNVLSPGNAEFVLVFSGALSPPMYDPVTFAYFNPVIASISITGLTGESIPALSAQYFWSSIDVSTDDSGSVTNLPYTAVVVQTGVPVVEGGGYYVSVGNSYIYDDNGAVLDRPYGFSVIAPATSSVSVPLGGLESRVSQDFSQSDEYWEWDTRSSSGHIGDGVYTLTAVPSTAEWGSLTQTGYYKRYPYALPSSGDFEVSTALTLANMEAYGGLYLSDSGGNRIAMIKIAGWGNAILMIEGSDPHNFSETGYASVNSLEVQNTLTFRKTGNSIYALVNGVVLGSIPDSGYSISNAGLFIVADNYDPIIPSRADVDSFSIAY